MHKVLKNRITWTLIRADTYKDEWKEGEDEWNRDFHVLYI